MSQKSQPARDLKLTKSWQYLVYLYLLLHALLFALAYLLRNTDFGVMLAGLFHNYGLYVIQVIPSFSNFTGVIGAGIALFLLGWAVRRRDWLDLLISLGLVGLNFAYFYLEWNYRLVPLLRFVSGAPLF